MPNRHHARQSPSETGRDYRELYQELFEHHHLPVLIIEPETGLIRDVNQKAVSFYQYSKDELMNMVISDINILDPDTIKAKMYAAKKNNTNSFHFRHRLKDGEIRDVKVDSIPVDFNGTHLLYSLITDITETLEKDSFFKALFNQSPYAIAILNRDYRISEVNGHFEALFGYGREEVLGLSPEFVIYPLDDESSMQDHIDQMERGVILTRDTLRKHKDGHLINVELIALPVYIESHLIATLAIYVDQTREKELEAHNQMLASVLENTGEGVVITNANSQIEWINQAFSTITEYTEQELIGKNPRLLKSGQHNAAFYHSMWHDLTTYGKWTGEIWNRRKNGDVYPEWLKIFALKDEEGEPYRYVGIVTDMSEVRAREERIDSLINQDKLTGLYNRYYVMRELEQDLIAAERYNQTATILFGDIDAFKSINENLGHAAGDELLRQMADLLQEVFAKALVARLSSDEFAIVFPRGTDDFEVRERLGLFFNELKKPFTLHNEDFYITCSFGVARYPDNGRERDDLMLNADIAMHHAKKREGNTFDYYTDVLGNQVKREFKVKTVIQRALDENLFHLHYQPTLSVQDGVIVGAEVLLRLDDPEEGRVSPGEFIPVAEKFGFIYSIGDWVLRNACKEALGTDAYRDGNLFLAVNVSVQQLENEAFPEQVDAILEETGFPAERLVFEVTEETSISDSDLVSGTLNALIEMGIQVAIDDFGTGYSSLGKIHQLNMHQLKIDQSFIRDIEKTTDIVHAIIAMGKSLRLNVVAEGVETEEQLAFLKEAGCDFAQGFYLHRPMPFADYRQLIE
ncbi:bifunctional diguanylate cyclase/phosphodiesterase [Salisediminibacterium selenitireducens]|uniref:Diguanylate cyclase/phosphodiesterase with PAS/PAC sensor(S) n=1 Tax=Bacillus selenitireducens (strain ATCC 700615 / DSM 15326 / MLS10) TaxID=439292 RepID=D6XYV9_BACIE|nr:bifunctional diguanylate cyclase/phosphodiesterase [Salisediminibacterium selenitireducens]ADH98267.1 diguanylate cyclase/phosphodiesterase with PAS/PAC sensor(s) [[Bacillus] selenitireducens MLS10]